MSPRPFLIPRTQRTEQVHRDLDAGHLDQARAGCLQLLESAPEDLEFMTLLAVIQRRQHDPLAALATMQRATRCDPLNDAVWRLYALDLATVGRADEAELALAQISPTNQPRPEVQVQRSLLQYGRHEFERATATLVATLNAYPDFARARFELSQVLLMRGLWKAGWLTYEARYQLAHTRELLPRLASPEWDGGSVTDPIVLIADQGYGDCFQFCRYIPLVAARCRGVVLLRSPPLARLLDTVPGVAAGYARWDELPAHVAHCTLSGLPRRLRTDPHNIPAGTGLLRVEPAARQRWQRTVEGAAGSARLRVGLAWSGRLDFRENYLRSIPVQALQPLVNVGHSCFFSLQFGALASQAHELGIVDTTAQQTPFAEAAALFEALDLIITTDTAVAHLAGALGRPTWLLLNYAPDWRWGPHGTRSGWYPSLRLFRQDASRSWTPVIATVAAALNEIAGATDAQQALINFRPS